MRGSVFQCVLPGMGEEAELRCPEALSGELEGVAQPEAPGRRRPRPRMVLGRRDPALSGCAPSCQAITVLPLICSLQPACACSAQPASVTSHDGRPCLLLLSVSFGL